MYLRFMNLHFDFFSRVDNQMIICSGNNSERERGNLYNTRYNSMNSIDTAGTVGGIDLARNSSFKTGSSFNTSPRGTYMIRLP